MGFVERAATQATGGTLDAALDRIRKNVEYGSENPRPEIDPKQQREFLAEQGQGKTDEPYRQSLEYHDFVWWPLLKLRMLPGTRLNTEGEWRSDKLGLAYTPNDLAMSFPMGPEQFDRFIREEKLKRQVTKGRVSKKDLKQAQRRR